ncbi:MAG: hypothetical protein AAF726_05420 [Planctomycetota bacterium]
MNILTTSLVLGAAAATFAATVPDETTLPETDLEIIHPYVDDFSELGGRAVLVEFFAEW